MIQLDEDSRGAQKRVRVTTEGEIWGGDSESGQGRTRVDRRTLGLFAVRLMQECVRSDNFPAGRYFTKECDELYLAWKASVAFEAGESDCDSTVAEPEGGKDSASNSSGSDSAASDSEAGEEALGDGSVPGDEEVGADGKTSGLDPRGSSSPAYPRESVSGEDSELDLPLGSSAQHEAKLVWSVQCFGTIASDGPLVRSVASDSDADSGGQGTATSGSGSVSPDGQAAAVTETGRIVLAESGEQRSEPTGTSSRDTRGDATYWDGAVQLWGASSRGARFQTYSCYWFPPESLGPPPEWLTEKDTGQNGTIFPEVLERGLLNLVDELKVDTVELVVNDAVYCVRCEMEYSLRSRVGAMVPRHMRHALEQLREESPLDKNETRLLIEAFVRLWKAEWAGDMEREGRGSRPFAKGQPWGYWVHGDPIQSAEKEGVAVRTWVPLELMNQLEDMLVDVEADPTLPRIGAAIQSIVQSVEDSASEPIPFRAMYIVCDGLSGLAAECLFLKRSRVERILGFKELWFRALQCEKARQRQMRSNVGQ